MAVSTNTSRATGHTHPPTQYLLYHHGLCPHHKIIALVFVVPLWFLLNILHPYHTWPPQRMFILMSITLMIQIHLWILEIIITVILNCVIQILKLPRFQLNSIHIYVNIVLQLQQHKNYYYYLEISSEEIIVSKDG